MIFVRSRERAWAGGRSLAEMRNEVLMEVLKTVRAPANTLTRLQPVSVRLYRVPGWRAPGQQIRKAARLLAARPVP